MSWIALTLSVLGAFLVTSLNSKIRFWAFVGWIFSNAYWLIMINEPALKVQFGIFLILAIVGVWNNKGSLCQENSG